MYEKEFPMTLQKYRNLFFFYPYIILGLLFLLCLLVWPLGLLGHVSHESTALDRGIAASIDLSGHAVAAGDFTPSGKRLESISFQFLKSAQAQDGTATLELYNSARTPVTSVSIDIADIMNYRWISFPINLPLEQGQTYTWRLQTDNCPEGGLLLYAGSATIGPKEAGAFSYNDTPLPAQAPYVTYTYRNRPDFMGALPYYIVFFLCGMLLFAMCRKFEPIHED